MQDPSVSIIELDEDLLEANRNNRAPTVTDLCWGVCGCVRVFNRAIIITIKIPVSERSLSSDKSRLIPIRFLQTGFLPCGECRGHLRFGTINNFYQFTFGDQTKMRTPDCSPLGWWQDNLYQ